MSPHLTPAAQHFSAVHAPHQNHWLGAGLFLVHPCNCTTVRVELDVMRNWINWDDMFDLLLIVFFIACFIKAVGGVV